jgi:hypothetical protein
LQKFIKFLSSFSLKKVAIVFIAQNELDFEKFMEYLILREDKTKWEFGWERLYHLKIIRWFYRLAIWEDPY